MKSVKLPDGTGYKRGSYEFWYDRTFRVWTVYHPETLTTAGHEPSRADAERLIDTLEEAGA